MLAFDWLISEVSLESELRFDFLSGPPSELLANLTRTERSVPSEARGDFRRVNSAPSELRFALNLGASGPPSTLLVNLVLSKTSAVPSELRGDGDGCGEPSTFLFLVNPSADTCFDLGGSPSSTPSETRGERDWRPFDGGFSSDDLGDLACPSEDLGDLPWPSEVL